MFRKQPMRTVTPADDLGVNEERVSHNEAIARTMDMMQHFPGGGLRERLNHRAADLARHAEERKALIAHARTAQRNWAEDTRRYGDWDGLSSGTRELFESHQKLLAELERRDKADDDAVLGD